MDYETFKKIEVYAKEHTESSIGYYKKRNSNTQNIFMNCLDGKIAEFNCYYELLSQGYILDLPDLEIHSDKNYNSDLVVYGKHDKIFDEVKYIHVKSVSTKTFAKIGISFLMEKNDPIVINPKENHFICVMIQKNLVEYFLHTWLKTTEINYNTPHNKRLTTKVAWYQKS